MRAGTDSAYYPRTLFSILNGPLFMHRFTHSASLVWVSWGYFWKLIPRVRSVLPAPSMCLSDELWWLRACVKYLVSCPTLLCVGHGFSEFHRFKNFFFCIFAFKMGWGFFAFYLHCTGPVKETFRKLICFSYLILPKYIHIAICTLPNTKYHFI